MFTFVSMKAIDKKGEVHGRLTVIQRMGSTLSGGKKRIHWLCKCSCGNEISIVSDSVGKTKSCGCLGAEIIGALNFKHGEANKTKENRTWYAIKERCYNPNCAKFPSYGARGISVCDRWINSYEDFLLDMGRAPTRLHSIDRIDVNGNYEPANCKWSTNTEQSNNKRNNVILTYENQTFTLAEWARYLGIKYKYLHAQITYKNKSLKDIIEWQTLKLQKQ